MLSKWLTEILVLLAVGLGVACVCIWLHEHGICPLKTIKKVMRCCPSRISAGVAVDALLAVGAVNIARHNLPHRHLERSDVHFQAWP